MEAEMQHKTLKRGKNLALSEGTCLEKERMWSEVTPRKVEVGLKIRWGWRLAWRGSTEKRPHICSNWQEDTII